MEMSENIMLTSKDENKQIVVDDLESYLSMWCKETDTSDKERKRGHVFTFVIREFLPFQSKLNFCNLMERERKSNFHHVISTFE